MRHTFLFSFLLLAFAFSSFAQETKFGIKGGYTTTNIDGSLAGLLNISGDYVHGFHAGVMANVGITDKIAFQPELLYTTAGTRQGIREINSSADIDLRYLSAPLLLKVYVADGFSIHAGPRMSILLDSNLGLGVDENSIETTLINQYKDFDFGVQFGASYEFTNGLEIGANYYRGLQNMADINFVDVKNQGIQAYVGYYIF